jgi:hypothetical protein
MKPKKQGAVLAELPESREAKLRTPVEGIERDPTILSYLILRGAVLGRGSA